MHPITLQVENCDLSQVDRKPTYLANMESIKSSQHKLVHTQVSQIRNFPIASSKSDNYVSTTTKSEGAKEARFQCGYCDKSFATPSKVKRHILTHTGEKPFVCQFCQRGFSQKVHMMEHISKHHADESLKAQQEAAAAAAAKAAVAQAAAPAPLIKTISSQSNSSKSSLYATHTISGNNVGGQLIQSSQSSQLRLSNALSATQVLADSTAMQIPIPENSYIVAEFSLKTEPHISQFEAIKEEPPEEEEHNTEIMATLPLSQHNSLTYPSLPRSPVSPTFLIQQSAAQPANANQTNYQLNSPSITSATALAQSNERPFVCPHCSADFIRQSNLSVHMMKVHGETVEVRTHQCSYCDKKFKYPNKRRLHEMTHTGEKPNVCQFCTMGFFKKSRLRVHLTKHHGIPEEEVNNPNSQYLQNPNNQNRSSPNTVVPVTSVTSTTQLTTTQALIQKTIAQIQNGTAQISVEGDHFCQYCQKPFSDKAELLEHERQEAMEFEQLHEMFEDTEFTGLGVGSGSQTDIIQNALLTAGIENGLGSPSVTDSDSVVTISEADIDSFSIGFIPDANWSNEVVSTSLPPITTASSDNFYHSSQPLDLNIKTTHSDQTQTSETGDQDLGNIQGTIYTTSDTFQNIKTEIPSTSLSNLTNDVVNQIWETTGPLANSVTSIKTEPLLTNIKTEPILTNMKTEPLLTSASGGEIFTTVTAGSLLNGIYTETFTIPSTSCGPETLSTNIISLGSLQTPTIINGNELDFNKLSGSITTQANYAVTSQQPINFMEGEQPTTVLASNTLQAVQTTMNNNNHINKTIINAGGQSAMVWSDDPTLPAGWKSRQQIVDGGRIETIFIAPDGVIFKSKIEIVEHMELSGTYCLEEIDWVKSGISNSKQTVTVLAAANSSPPRPDKMKREWKDDDPTVPAGWKVAWTTTSDNRSKIAFMSPDKKIFHSRKAALQHMMTEGTYDPADIVKMTKGLNVLLNVGDEWKEGDKSLPEGWKIRSHQWWCQKRNSHRIHYEFLSPLNEFFKSRKSVVEHMSQSGAYTPQQIEMVRNAQTAAVPATKPLPKKAGGVNNNNTVDRTVTIPSGPTRADLSPCNPLIGWKTGNSTLPIGWKIKRHEYANQTVYFYMSPKGEVIKSRRAVLDHMFEDGSYSEKDFNTVISGAKQRKVALQDLYDSKMNKKKKKRKRKDSEASKEEEGSEVDEREESDDLDDLDDDDDDEDLKRSPKKLKVEKKEEAPLPTRRSGRIKTKERRRDFDDDSDDSAESDIEAFYSPVTNKTEQQSQQSQATGDVVKRKRGRPPKNPPATADISILEEVVVGDKEALITDTMLKVEKMGSSLIKIEGRDNKTNIDDTHHEQNTMVIKNEIYNFTEDEILQKYENNDVESIQHHLKSLHQLENADDKLTRYLVTSTSDNYLLEQIYMTPSTGDDGTIMIENKTETPQKSHSVVVNVLNDIVSSVSE